MLNRIDRLQLAVPDSKLAAAGWVDLLGAEHQSEDKIKCLAAKRSSYSLGNCTIEFLQADGSGVVADAVASRGGHLFSAGASSADMDALKAHLKKQDLNPAVEGGQIFLEPADTGDFGLRIVVSPEEKLESVGAIDFLYEITLLVHNAASRVKEFATLFGLDGEVFVPIKSDGYGYDGSLTLFQADKLHRFEMITPFDSKNTMGRFFTRFGETYYMAYGESASISAIEEKARDKNYPFTTTPPDRPEGRDADTLFVHPPVLGGMMLGISRPTVAWQWSGHPERVEAAS